MLFATPCVSAPLVTALSRKPWPQPRHPAPPGRWFGLAAGRPGTAFYVSFARSSDGLWSSPMPIVDRRPGETAYVLARPPGEGAWRYLGVARYSEEEGLWVCPGARAGDVGER